jgi:hypothetical protein
MDCASVGFARPGFGIGGKTKKLCRFLGNLDDR